ncbi:hypothetical protein JTE90_024779 [Oedothorax gibbosus]|uniref:Uncharacterized protein n=1 Tax=Oedothorax gibbosus TaxID=931172 RepID=A0AAV6UBD4_9ARAC|nr:hypothetical protein JTE90_024779 [Oedothorax gibbosus]
MYASISTGKRSQKSQGLRKIGCKCPASIKVHITENEMVSVTAYNYHYGHKNELAHLPIPKSDKAALASQLSQGIEHQRILKNIYEDEISEVERKHLCTKRDLLNIAKSYGATICKHIHLVVSYQKKEETEVYDEIRQNQNSNQLDIQDVSDDTLSEHCFETRKVTEQLVPVEDLFERDLILNSINPSGRENLEALKKSLLEKHMQLLEKIMACDNRDVTCCKKSHY